MNKETAKSFAIKHPLFIGTAIILSLLFSIAVDNSIRKSTANDSKRKKEIVESITRSQDNPIVIDNSENPPILIQSASVKQVTGAEYQHLTGVNSTSITYVTFPSVELINNSDRTIKEITLLLVDKHSNKNKVLMLMDRNIEPFTSFHIESVDWAKPRKQMTKKLIEKDGVFQEDTSLPTLASEEMWLPGGFRDFSLLVGQVKFADGREWITQR